MIYFIQEKNDKQFVKIGVTSLRIDRRLSTLQTGNPRELEIVLVLKGMYDLEDALHNKFKHLHKQGEWFHFTQEIQNFIANPYDVREEVRPKKRTDYAVKRKMFTWD